MQVLHIIDSVLGGYYITINLTKTKTKAIGEILRSHAGDYLLTSTTIRLIHIRIIYGVINASASASSKTLVIKFALNSFEIIQHSTEIEREKRK